MSRSPKSVLNFLPIVSLCLKTISEPGNIKVVGKGVTQFTPAKDGNCRYMTVTPEQVKQILDYFYQVIPQKPKCKK